MAATTDGILEQPSSSFWGWVDSFSTYGKMGIFTLASYATDPATKAHEFYRRFSIVDAMNPEAYRVTNYVKKAALLFGAFNLAVIALYLSVPAIGLRALACRFEREPFIHLTGTVGAKDKKPEFLSLLSWNICCIPSGHVITDGGVMPWTFRIDAIEKKVHAHDADVVCLYEVFDIQTARHLYSSLKDRYAHFYFNIGARGKGVSSGLFVASKYEIKNPSFTAFPKEMLVGRTKSAEKGFFMFDLAHFATVVTTHLQHSEEPAFPDQENKEVDARRQEMELIMKKTDQVKNRALIITGDLNMDDPEYEASSWAKSFDRGVVALPSGAKTWGGDEFCAKLVGKKASQPLNLDHTMIRQGSAVSIQTDLVRSGYQAGIFNQKALSDHEGLISRIQLV